MALACAGLLSGCNAREVAPPQSDSKSSAVVADVNADKTEYHEFSLTIYGYNYTDTGPAPMGVPAAAKCKAPGRCCNAV